MTRRILIIGLIVLAAFLPLAAPPVAVFVVSSPVFVAGDQPVVSSSAQPVALLALALFRAPPSR